MGIKDKWRGQRILASGKVTRNIRYLKSIEELAMELGGLGKVKMSGRFKFQRLLVSLQERRNAGN